MPALPPGERGCISPELTACAPPLPGPRPTGPPRWAGGEELQAPFPACRLAFLHAFQARVGVRPPLSASFFSFPPPIFYYYESFQMFNISNKKEKKPNRPTLAHAATTWPQ